MSTKIYVTKKTHLTSAPLGKKVAFVEFETDLEVGQFLQKNRSNIIKLKDCLLNRENLSTAELEEKVNQLKSAINGSSELPKDFKTPLGIRTQDEIDAREAREKAKLEAKTKKIEEAEITVPNSDTPKPEKKKAKKVEQVV